MLRIWHSFWRSTTLSVCIWIWLSGLAEWSTMISWARWETTVFWWIHLTLTWSKRMICGISSTWRSLCGTLATNSKISPKPNRLRSGRASLTLMLAYTVPRTAQVKRFSAMKLKAKKYCACSNYFRRHQLLTHTATWQNPQKTSTFSLWGTRTVLAP